MDKPNFERLDFEQLAQETLHRRRVCRPRGVPISLMWQLILDDARCILVSKLQRLTQIKDLILRNRYTLQNLARTGAYTAKHVRGHPEASFKAIALAYLDGWKWEEIAQYLWRLHEDVQTGKDWRDEQYRRGGVEKEKPISVGTLSTFYQRSLTKFRPMLADCIREME